MYKALIQTYNNKLYLVTEPHHQLERVIYCSEYDRYFQKNALIVARIDKSSPVYDVEYYESIPDIIVAHPEILIA